MSSKVTQVQIVPPVKPVSQSTLPIADGRATPASINIGGIVVLCGGLDSPRSAPGLFVPSGATVRLRGHNGTAIGNVGSVFVGLSPDDVLHGNSDVLTVGTEIIYPVNNLAEIWVLGAAGDGVAISVRR